MVLRKLRTLKFDFLSEIIRSYAISFFNALLQMLFNLGQITRSPVQILDLCSKFESSSNILPSYDRNALRKYFKVTSLARSGYFRTDDTLKLHSVQEQCEIYLLTTSGLCTMTTATSGIGAEAGAATVAMFGQLDISEQS
ncbi:Hypothetical_protein [Hexamita inflata]|uniref:Hypothetical_protein n=1 Tax=Hexamita inflata TaxID=28002 RepID=A0ABP1JFE6_9EUKA